MGQQQILMLLLSISILGIAVSCGVIAIQGAVEPDCRELLVSELKELAIDARGYYQTPLEHDGGGGTFLGLEPGFSGIRQLSAKPSTGAGDFYIAREGDVSSVEIVALGTRRGRDNRLPIRVVATVYADSTAIRIIN